jgi:hypothetical protein
MVAALLEDYELLEIKNTEGRFTVCRYQIELVVTPVNAGVHSLEKLGSGVRRNDGTVILNTTPCFPSSHPKDRNSFIAYLRISHATGGSSFLSI